MRSFSSMGQGMESTPAATWVWRETIQWTKIQALVELTTTALDQNLQLVDKHSLRIDGATATYQTNEEDWSHGCGSGHRSDDTVDEFAWDSTKPVQGVATSMANNMPLSLCQRKHAEERRMQLRGVEFAMGVGAWQRSFVATETTGGRGSPQRGPANTLTEAPCQPKCLGHLAHVGRRRHSSAAASRPQR